MNSGNIIIFGCETGLIYGYKINEDFLKNERAELGLKDKIYQKFRGHEASVTSISLQYDGNVIS